MSPKNCSLQMSITITFDFPGTSARGHPPHPWKWAENYFLVHTFYLIFCILQYFYIFGACEGYVFVCSCYIDTLVLSLDWRLMFIGSFNLNQNKINNWSYILAMKWHLESNKVFCCDAFKNCFALKSKNLCVPLRK